MQTREQWAALEFDPVSPEIAEPFENPDWDEECSELGVVGRMPACCCKTPEGRADWLVPHPAVAALVPVLKARHYFTN
jgi:hypothetical protein